MMWRIGINDVAGCCKKDCLHYVCRAKINGKLKICGKAGKSWLAATSAKNYSDFAKFKLEQLHTLNVNINEHYHLIF
jgi:hypothetical protein